MANMGTLYIRLENGDYIPLGSYADVKRIVENSEEYQRREEMLDQLITAANENRQD